MLPAAAPPGRAERSGAGSRAAPAAWLGWGWVGLGWAGRLGPGVRRHRSTCAPSRAAGEAPERGRASPAGRGITPPGANPAQGAAPRPGPRLRPRRRRCAAPSVAAARRPGPAPSRAEGGTGAGAAGQSRSPCGVSLRPGPRSSPRARSIAAPPLRREVPVAAARTAPARAGFKPALEHGRLGRSGRRTLSFGKDAVKTGVKPVCVCVVVQVLNLKTPSFPKFGGKTTTQKT
ncbi:translation initiation factor IF-2-like [Harpia harpyja]|uniref:translation initiation factor IF-2-like n=1 Tax=Harpia harpyja TaxID=202280 RepID=UPI0022B15DD8|nr:translation initiation factor IF-2-like [Harpia harpyja]